MNSDSYSRSSFTCWCGGNFWFSPSSPTMPFFCESSSEVWQSLSHHTSLLSTGADFFSYWWDASGPCPEHWPRTDTIFCLDPLPVFTSLLDKVVNTVWSMPCVSSSLLFVSNWFRSTIEIRNAFLISMSCVPSSSYFKSQL